MLLVRQGFQGTVLAGPEVPLAEFYGYSLAGLVLSIALLVAGIRLPDKALRLAGLILLTATISKVFLVDASELEGIWRILSGARNAPGKCAVQAITQVIASRSYSSPERHCSK